MPQLMPLNWMFLILFFIMIFFILNIFIYFNFNKMSSSLKVNKKKINWKWWQTYFQVLTYLQLFFL